MCSPPLSSGEGNAQLLRNLLHGETVHLGEQVGHLLAGRLLEVVQLLLQLADAVLVILNLAEDFRLGGKGLGRRGGAGLDGGIVGAVIVLVSHCENLLFKNVFVFPLGGCTIAYTLFRVNRFLKSF